MPHQLLHLRGESNSEASLTSANHTVQTAGPLLQCRHLPICPYWACIKCVAQCVDVLACMLVRIRMIFIMRRNAASEKTVHPWLARRVPYLLTC